MERKTAEPLPIRAPRRPGLAFCFAVAGVLTLLIPGLAGACTEPVEIQDCIQGGGRVGYSAAVRGPACQGGTADACPVRMGPGGPAPAGGSSGGSTSSPFGIPPTTRDARPSGAPSGYDSLEPWLKRGDAAAPAPATESTGGSGAEPLGTPPTTKDARPKGAPTGYEDAEPWVKGKGEAATPPPASGAGADPPSGEAKKP